VKYSTVQKTWYPGDEDGKGGIYNFVTKRADLPGRPGQGDVDAGRNRLGGSRGNTVLHPARRWTARGGIYSIAIANTCSS